MPTLAQTKPPCKHCEERHESCWGTCSRYQEYRRIHGAEKQWKRERDVVDGVGILCVERIKREKRRRRK